jgi:hypothetical protein
MSRAYAHIPDDIRECVIKEHNDNIATRREHDEIVEDYKDYIASYEYAKSSRIESVCEEIEAYTTARGNYYELILFYLQDFLQSFNYTKYIYLRFHHNIKSDSYYAATSDSDGKVNVRNLVATLRDSKLQDIFTNIYKTKETLAKFAFVITKRIKDNFVFHNYYRNGIKHPYIYKSTIYNYLLRDMVIDYTTLIDKFMCITPCEHDNIFLTDIITDINIDIDNNEIYKDIYSIDFETFVDLSFIIKYYTEHFSKDGRDTLMTFYCDTMKYLAIPELYKPFLHNIKKSKEIYDVYEKTKYSYTFIMKEELCDINKDLCPTLSGLQFICKCNYIYNLWRKIFNSTSHYYYYYPEKKVISRIRESILRHHIKNDSDECIDKR